MQPTYSYSRITAYDKCPRSYRYRYLDKIREAFTSIEAHLGRAAHAALAWLYEARESGESTEVPDLLARFDAEFTSGLGPAIRVIRDTDSVEARRELGRQMLEEHHRGPFRLDRRKTLATEQNLRTRLDGDYLYRGIIDRTATDANGDLHLLDYKTTGRPPTSLDEEGALQLRSYGMLALEAHGGGQVHLTYQFLKNGQELTETFELEEVPGLSRELSRRISRTERAESFPARPSKLCAWCGYREICDASGFYAGRGSGADAANTCPSCEGPLRQRNGKFGSFLGCSNYPRCSYTRNA